MLSKIKHRLVRKIEKIPLLQIFIYNNLQYFKFLFPHDKDYYALQKLFPKNEKRTFIDVGGNIGLSTIGFRELGFNQNKIYVFEPDYNLIKKYLKKIKQRYNKIKIFNFGLSNKETVAKLYKAFYKKKFFHFNNSFDKNYIINKLRDNYGEDSSKFIIKSSLLRLKKFDDLNILEKICFIKIDVEGLDHLVLYGMKKCIKKNFPVFLIEYNLSNFKKIYNFLKKYYEFKFYNFKKNKLVKINDIELSYLKRGKILEKEFKKNSVNIFFIKKKQLYF